MYAVLQYFIVIIIYSGKTYFCRQKLFLPVRFFSWKIPFFPPSGKNLPTLDESVQVTFTSHCTSAMWRTWKSKNESCRSKVA